MAKKGSREIVALICSECKSQNYATTRNKINMEKKLEIKKYCKTCKKHTLHKESTKLK
ncbi:MAG: 50S ribosomal protein L33 [Microgenomates group bacterium]